MVAPSFILSLGAVLLASAVFWLRHHDSLALLGQEIEAQRMERLEKERPESAGAEGEARESRTSDAP
jgi:hypothetical protein